MEVQLLKKIKMGIATKMAIAVGAVILLLLVANGIIFLSLESNLVSFILDDFKVTIKFNTINS